MSSKNKKPNVADESGKDPYVESLVRKGNWAQIKKLAKGGNKAAIKVRDHRDGVASKPADNKKAKENAE